jgi:hypothetical protein
MDQSKIPVVFDNRDYRGGSESVNARVSGLDEEEV